MNGEVNVPGFGFSGVNVLIQLCALANSIVGSSSSAHGKATVS